MEELLFWLIMKWRNSPTKIEIITPARDPKQCGGVVGSQGTRYEQNKGINQQNRGFLGIKKGRKRED